MIDTADPIQLALGIWGLIGLTVAIAFLALGFDKIDEAAHGAYAVRPLLVPGLVLLWPLVIWRWTALSRQKH
ncbi:hypothetical protein [Methylovirgula sp. 4M-Z18]|uniref:hypothetical protein n=1 Tax=Methylovirgula sp. 4M-Z18 TaxID=2293567 RepID=UPI000E2F4FC7|nr:hypothetical protein [Methylovirgula sp. 4M-Z18]RFB77974.1 hypothetical protein DYH55_18315 [Methylovirgula sp. 4M-Z18]